MKAFSTVQRKNSKISRNPFIASTVDGDSKLKINRDVSGDAISISNLDPSEYTQASAYHQRMSKKLDFIDSISRRTAGKVTKFNNWN